MELFELFGKIVISGADEANKSIDSVADNAEKAALRICRAFEKIGGNTLGIESVKMPDLKIMPDIENTDAQSSLHNFYRDANWQNGILNSSHNENVNYTKRTENFSENVDVHKNITEMNADSITESMKKINQSKGIFKDYFNTEGLNLFSLEATDNIENIGEKALNMFSNLDKSVPNGENFFGEIPIDKINNFKEIVKKTGEEFAVSKISSNTFLDSFAESVSKSEDELKNAVGRVTSKVGNEQDNIIADILRSMTAGFNKTGKIALSGMEKMAGGIRNGSNKVINECGQVAGKAADALNIDAASSGSRLMNTFKSGIASEAQSVYQAALDVAENISAIMSNISIPEISVPVKSYSGPVNSPSDARLAAHAKGGIVTREHIARVGEDGAEAIIPLEKNTEWIDRVAARMSGSTSNSEVAAKLDEVISLLKNQKIYLDGKTLVGGISGEMDRKLGSMARLKRRMV